MKEKLEELLGKNFEDRLYGTKPDSIHTLEFRCKEWYKNVTKIPQSAIEIHHWDKKTTTIRLEPDEARKIAKYIVENFSPISHYSDPLTDDRFGISFPRKHIQYNGLEFLSDSGPYGFNYNFPPHEYFRPPKIGRDGKYYTLFFCTADCGGYDVEWYTLYFNSIVDLLKFMEFDTSEFLRSL